MHLLQTFQNCLNSRNPNRIYHLAGMIIILLVFLIHKYSTLSLSCKIDTTYSALTPFGRGLGLFAIFPFFSTHPLQSAVPNDFLGICCQKLLFYSDFLVDRDHFLWSDEKALLGAGRGHGATFFEERKSSLLQLTTSTDNRWKTISNSSLNPRTRRHSAYQMSHTVKCLV